MENISIVIKAVFGKFKGSEALGQLGYLEDRSIDVPGKECHLDTVMLESQLVNKMLEVSAGHSLDQISLLQQLTQSKLMNSDGDCRSLQFSSTPSVFNILLHFSSKTLTTTNGNPVCRYEQLLRWHLLTVHFGEDLFTTSYLASHDIKIHSQKRDSFGWKPYLGHNCKEINEILDRELVDLHMHLKGSSLNCEIGWLCLMNNFGRMQKQLREEFLTRKYLGDVNLSQIVNKAASIRLYLAGAVGCIPQCITSAQLHTYLRASRNTPTMQNCHIKDVCANMQHVDIQCLIDDSRKQVIKQCVQNRMRWSEDDILDYVPVDHYLNEPTTNLVLASERKLMYNLFWYVYDDRSCKNDDIPTLFYAYLLYKKQYRDLVLQLNDRVGFANFSVYESRKTNFILDRYKPLLYKVAIQGFLENDNLDCNRYVEARVSPEETLEEISQEVNKIYSSIEPKYAKHYHLIFHFIKQRDDYGKNAPFRHSTLRTTLKKQSFAIYQFRCERKFWQSGNNLVGMVVGIDAANSEIYCRPEVFAQAFRFLKKHNLYDGNVYARPADLHRTFHVGEDYLDIADGLRAVEEALIFLNLENGDRIGHALVLGVDVDTYYEKRHHTICARKQVLLDNFAWLYHKCTRLMGYTPLCGYLKSMFRKYFDEVFGNASSIEKDIISHLFDEVDNKDISNDIDDYYQSWLLRGNSPKIGEEWEKLKGEDSSCDSIEREWIHAGINQYRASIAACHNEKARELFDKYHSYKVIDRGDEVDSFSVHPTYRKDFYTLLKMIQEHLLDKIEYRHIAIECNPSSNYKIGGMERYDQHPILRFFNYGLHTPYPSRNLTVSINTDDQGIFATSLEREYSLMALAVERNHSEMFGNSSRTVVEWLERIRKMSVEQKFID